MTLLLLPLFALLTAHAAPIAPKLEATVGDYRIDRVIVNEIDLGSPLRWTIGHARANNYGPEYWLAVAWVSAHATAMDWWTTEVRHLPSLTVRMTIDSPPGKYSKADIRLSSADHELARMSVAFREARGYYRVVRSKVTELDPLCEGLLAWSSAELN